MRVAINAEQLLYHSPGGIGRYTAQLLAGLPSGPEGDQVVPFVARHAPAAITWAFTEAGLPPAVADGTRVLRLPRPALYEGWLTGPGRPRLPDLDRPDVVHAPSVAVPPRWATPLVVTVHDVATELFPETFPKRGRRFHARGLAAAARRADVVITVSEAAAADIADHSKIGPDRIRVVHNGVDPPAMDQERADSVLTDRGLAGRRYVLWVGSLEPRKGAETLVSAMAGLRRRHPDDDTLTVLAGYDGWLQDGLVAGADRTVLGDTLVQLGRVTDEELWALYRGATVFAFPSRYEGFGLPVVEAMSQGVPVVASDIAVMREVAGSAALLVPPEDVAAWTDAISSVLDDEAEAGRLGRVAAERGSTFTVAAMLSATRAVYHDVAR